MISLPRLGFLRGVFLANHLASTDNLTRITKRQNIQQRLTIHKRGLINNNNNIKHAKMWHTEPGLVALYDIWPRNRAGLFLQPQSLHWALIFYDFHSRNNSSNRSDTATEGQTMDTRWGATYINILSSTQ